MQFYYHLIIYNSVEVLSICCGDSNVINLIGCAADIADSLGGVGILEANMTSQARFCGYAFSTMTF